MNNEKFVLICLSRYQYFEKGRGETHEYASFCEAFENIGYQIIFIDTASYILSRNISALNEEIIKVASRNKNNIKFSFFVQLKNEIFPETLRLLDLLNIKSIYWAADDSYRFGSHSKYISNNYSLNLSTEQSCVDLYGQQGKNSIKVNWAAPRSWVFDVLPSDACTFDVTFVGLNYFDREKYINFLKDHGISVNVFGFGWPDGPIENVNTIPKIFNSSKIVLNFSRTKIGYQTKARVFEAVAAGSCLVTEASEDLETYFKLGSEIMVFQNEFECLKLIKMLLKNPKLRDRIAKQGQDRYNRCWSYEQQFMKIVKDVQGLKSSKSYVSRNKCIEIIQNLISKNIKKLIFHKSAPNFIRCFAERLERRLFPLNYYSKSSWSIK